MKQLVKKKKKQKFYKIYFQNVNFLSAEKFHEKCLHLLFGKYEIKVKLDLFLNFFIRACGGQVSWDKTICPGASYDVADQTITHQLVDRPTLHNMVVNRTYIQPQWVFDCINARQLLPVDKYLPG